MSRLTLRRRKPQPRRFRPGLYITTTWQPPQHPAPEPVELPVPWTPPYAELEVAKVLRRHGDSHADIAARWLREAAAVNGVNTGGAP